MYAVPLRVFPKWTVWTTPSALKPLATSKRRRSIIGSDSMPKTGMSSVFHYAEDCVNYLELRARRGRAPKSSSCTVGTFVRYSSYMETHDKRNTKRIGDVSEVMVLGAFIRAGYFVSIPFGGNQRYDLIAEKNNRLCRVQVKTGRFRKGAIVFACYSMHAYRGGGMRRNRIVWGLLSEY